MREAPGAWKTLVNTIVDVQGYNVAEISHDTGLYAHALLEMGAAHVTCIDASQETLDSAHKKLASTRNASYILGDALHPNIEDQQFNLVLERDLLSSVQSSDLQACMTEARNHLTHGGTLIIQDRTPDDCLQSGSQSHIHGFFFERYPRLAQAEVAGHHSNTAIIDALQSAGFRMIQKRQLWETCKLYGTLDALSSDLYAQQGSSVLRELSDTEMQDLIEYIQRQLDTDALPIIEQKRWTIWSAIR